jgi:hypothetical protein
MHSWTILAAKHAALTPGVALGAIPAVGWDSLDGIAVGVLLAGIGFAAMSPRRVPNCPLPPVGGQIAVADGGSLSLPGRSRFRRRVDGVLTGMLSDDADKLNPPAGGRDGHRPDAAEPRFDAPSPWHGDYVDALPARREPDSHPYPDVPASSSEALQSADGALQSGPHQADAWSRPAYRVSAAPWPWLTSTAAVDGEQLWPLESARADGRPLPSPAERRRDAVQRFMAAPVVDLGMVREERAREHGPLDVTGEPDVPAGQRDPKAAERDRAAAERTRRTGATPSARVDPGIDPGFPGSIPGSTLDDEADSAIHVAEISGSDDISRDSGSGCAADDDRESGASGDSEASRDLGRSDDSGSGRGRGDGRRAKPRHAAPPASLGAAISRTLTGTRLTSRSAAHAG